jgi:hypothetical protein
VRVVDEIALLDFSGRCPKSVGDSGGKSLVFGDEESVKKLLVRGVFEGAGRGWVLSVYKIEPFFFKSEFISRGTCRRGTEVVIGRRFAPGCGT